MTRGRLLSFALLATATTLLCLSGCSAVSEPDQPLGASASTTSAVDPATPSVTSPVGSGSPLVRPPAHDASEIARTTRVGSKRSDVIYDARPADARTDRWSIDAACSTSKGTTSTAKASYTVRLVGNDKHPNDLRIVASGELDCTSTPVRVDGLRLNGRNVQIDITTGSEPVGSYYGLVLASER